jgi:transcriptional regulator with XRE-family HTH domain
VRGRSFDELGNFSGFEHLLITLRIVTGISQRELAHRLGVHESQVSKDERSRYAGITLKRAAKILEALNVSLQTRVKVKRERESRNEIARLPSRWRGKQNILQLPENKEFAGSVAGCHTECSRSFE